MEILEKTIDSFTFEDIEQFCAEGHTEGIQLDYKKDIPPIGLAKIIASFSNTRGGVIIIGVEEDKTTGTPKKWEGIGNSSKHEERIYQFAHSVEPFPSIEVYKTNDKNKKVFVLIRVFEGDATPYYVHNDPNIYIRTGNITTHYTELAHPEVQRMLFEKTHDAEVARELNERFAYSVFSSKLKQESKDFKILQSDNNSKPEEKRRILFNGKLGTCVSMCNTFLQPYYPIRHLIKPQQLFDEAGDFRASIAGYDYPQNTRGFEAIPNGIFHFEFDERDGSIKSEQIFSSGLLWDNYDVLHKGTEISIAHVVLRLTLVLKCAKKFYKKLNYHGVVTGGIKVSNTAGTNPVKIGFNGFWDDKEDIKSSLSLLEWDLELDTTVLNNDESLKQFIHDKTKDISWSFGIKGVNDKQLEDFFSKNKLFD